MAVRPRDYGDPRPSDLDDTPPSNPASNYSEIDYTIDKSGGGRKTKPRANATLYPDQKVPEAVRPARDTFAGLLISQTTDRGVYPTQYTCLRQDGKYGIAKVFGAEDSPYTEHRAGDQVALISSQIPDEWLIVSAPRSVLQPNLEVKLSSLTEVVTNTSITIPFNETVTDIGNGQSEIILAANGAVIVGTREEAHYDIEYQITVVFLDPNSSTVGSTIKAGLNCTASSGTDVDTVFANQLLMSKLSGFKLRKNGNCSAEYYLNGNSTDYLLHQPAGGGPAKWTGDVGVAGSIKVGTKLTQGWVKIGGKVWFGNGDADVHYRFPNEVPKFGDFLVVTAVNGPCVQLSHFRGGNGTIRAYDCYNQCQSWVVKKGLIISGPGITTPLESSGGQVVCDDKLAGTYQC